MVKATGHDNIPNKILKIAAPVILFQLIEKLQRSFRYLNQVNVMIQMTSDRFLSYQL